MENSKYIENIRKFKSATDYERLNYYIKTERKQLFEDFPYTGDLVANNVIRDKKGHTKEECFIHNLCKRSNVYFKWDVIDGWRQGKAMQRSRLESIYFGLCQMELENTSENEREELIEKQVKGINEFFACMRRERLRVKDLREFLVYAYLKMGKDYCFMEEKYIELTSYIDKANNERKRVRKEANVEIETWSVEDHIEKYDIKTEEELDAFLRSEPDEEELPGIDRMWQAFSETSRSARVKYEKVLEDYNWYIVKAYSTAEGVSRKYRYKFGEKFYQRKYKEDDRESYTGEVLKKENEQFEEWYYNIHGKSQRKAGGIGEGTLQIAREWDEDDEEYKVLIPIPRAELVYARLESLQGRFRKNEKGYRGFVNYILPEWENGVYKQLAGNRTVSRELFILTVLASWARKFYTDNLKKKVLSQEFVDELVGKVESSLKEFMDEKLQDELYAYIEFSPKDIIADDGKISPTGLFFDNFILNVCQYHISKYVAGENNRSRSSQIYFDLAELCEELDNVNN